MTPLKKIYRTFRHHTRHCQLVLLGSGRLLTHCRLFPGAVSISPAQEKSLQVHRGQKTPSGWGVNRINEGQSLSEQEGFTGQCLTSAVLSHSSLQCLPSSPVSAGTRQVGHQLLNQITELLILCPLEPLSLGRSTWVSSLAMEHLLLGPPTTLKARTTADSTKVVRPPFPPPPCPDLPPPCPLLLPPSSSSLP